jgi:hypothetical protein
VAAAIPAPQNADNVVVSLLAPLLSSSPSTSSPVGYGDAPQPTDATADNQSGNVDGYPNADAPYASEEPAPLTVIPTSFGGASAVAAVETAVPTDGPLAGAPQRSSILTGATTHGPFEGEATTTGAVSTTVLAPSIPALPPNPTATYYNTNGKLQEPQPAPYVPAGGLGTNGTLPRYMVESDFDYESIVLGLYQEWIELDVFNNAVATFSEDDFLAAGLNQEDISLIQFMAQQEQGHATLLSNMLGETAPPQCTYNYPYTNVRPPHTLPPTSPSPADTPITRSVNSSTSTKS